MLALCVAVVIFHGAWEVVRDALRNLVDRGLSPDEIARVKHVFDSDPYVLGYHKLRTRMAGSSRHIDAHVMMDDNLTLLESHELTEGLEETIRAALPDSIVTLHTEPYHAECEHQEGEHGGRPEDETIKDDVATFHHKPGQISP